MSMGNLLSPTLRAEFPLLERQFAPGQPLIYLDSAATALRPRPVIQAVTEVMALHSGNVHRAVHVLGDEATALFEGARRKVARLIGAESHEVVLVRNTTEALNLVARCFPARRAERSSPSASTIPTCCRGATPRESCASHLAPTDARTWTDCCASWGGAAWPLSRSPTSPTWPAAGWTCAAWPTPPTPPGPSWSSTRPSRCRTWRPTCSNSIVTFSPSAATNWGAPPGRAGPPSDGKAGSRPPQLDWYLHGGGTVEQVVQGTPVPRQAPWRLEAGTPALEAVVGMGAAIDFLQDIGLENIEAHVCALYQYARARLAGIRGARLIGQPLSPVAGHAGPLSFTIPDVPAHLIARALSDGHGICVRYGYHCAQPLHEHLGSPPTVRVSFYLYNQPWEIDRFFEVLAQILAHGRLPA